jgi:hypothetical protein
VTDVAPENKIRKRRRRTPRTWTGRAAASLGTSKRQVQSYAVSAMGLLALLFAVYWFLRE